MSTDAIGAAEESAPTTELGAGAVADRCTNCAAPLSSDQRYCVNCGERRGGARFSPEMLAAQPAPAVAEAAVPPRQHRPRASYAATLVAGVATLLIAMGVGVLIGHYSNNNPPAHTPAAQIITVGGGASGAASGAANTGSGAASNRAATQRRPVHAKPTVVRVTAKAAKAATAAASKVLGSSANKNLTQNPTQQIGGSCSGGAGCQGGKFTGNYFPSG